MIIGPPVYRFGDLRIRTDGSPGKYGFSVGLARPFVAEVMAVSIDDSMRGSFQEVGRDVLRRCGCERREPYSFFRESLLVTDFGLGREGR